MTAEIVTTRPTAVATRYGLTVPTLVADLGEEASRRFLEFFTAHIRNPNTREAYARAVARFLGWCEGRGIGLRDVEPVLVAAYIEAHPGSAPTVKQHLAAIRMLFDWLVLGQVVRMNPASAVRGPAYIVKKGKTPVLTAAEARQLLDSIDVGHVVGLRDRALIGVMVYSFARVGAVVRMTVADYRTIGRRASFCLHEKGGKFHEVPAHHNAALYLDAYLDVAGIAAEKNSPLWRSAIRRTRQLTDRPISRVDAFRMIQRRARDAAISADLCCHTFRATGITTYLENGGSLEHAQVIAGHESPRTTKLYDRTTDFPALDEIERITI